MKTILYTFLTQRMYRQRTICITNIYSLKNNYK